MNQNRLASQLQFHYVACQRDGVLEGLPKPTNSKTHIPPLFFDLFKCSVKSRTLSRLSVTL